MKKKPGPLSRSYVKSRLRMHNLMAGVCLLGSLISLGGLAVSYAFADPRAEMYGAEWISRVLIIMSVMLWMIMGMQAVRLRENLLGQQVIKETLDKLLEQAGAGESGGKPGGGTRDKTDS
jgi:hypothetical protein